jgi:hypothetical protein
MLQLKTRITENTMNQSAVTDWWNRNWKWFAPVGGLASLLILAGGFGAILSFVFGLLRSSDVYQQALAKARSSPAVIEAVGVPINEGFFMSGNIAVSGPSGNANLAIPISGPSGSGTIFLEARKSVGEWSFTKLVFEASKSDQRIDLLTHSPVRSNP